MNKKLYTIDPDELTAQERRTAIFLAGLTHLINSDDFDVGFELYESTQLLNAADQIKRRYKSDANHGEKFAEKFFQMYLMNSRTEAQLMAQINSELLAIERVKVAINDVKLYGTDDVKERLTQTLKAVTIDDPKRREEIVNAACALAAWRGVLDIAATAYDTCELVSLDKTKLIRRKANSLDDALMAQLYETDNKKLFDRKKLGDITETLARRKIGNYFDPHPLATLSRRKAVNDFLTFEPMVITDIYSRLYDDKSNAIKTARQNKGEANK